MIASLLSPSSSNPPQAGRISQLLPSVKCSTCHRPVPLDELGDHTCVAPPPVPGLPKPSMTPEAAAALLPGRLQGRVGSPGPIPSSSSAPRLQDPQHQRMASSSSTSSRLRINTRGGGSSPTQPTFQPRSSPLARNDVDPRDQQQPFPTSSSSAAAAASPLRTRMRTPSNAGSVSSINPPRMRTPSNNSSMPSMTNPPRMRTPSNAGSMSNPPRMRTPSNAGSMSNQRPPPPSSFNPNQDVLPPSAPPLRNNGPNGPAFPMQQRSPSIHSMHSMNNFPPGPGGRLPPGGPGPFSNSINGVSGGPRPMGAPPGNPAAPPPPPGRPDLAFVPPAERGIDTKSGGAAGMAGVGRRGFAAAARAAMFVGPGPQQPPMPQGPGLGQGEYGMRRPNAPQYLDIDAVSRSASTPPLSAGSGYSSHSPTAPTSPSPISQSDFASNFAGQNQPKNIAAIKQLQTRTPSPSIPSSATPTLAMPLSINPNVAPAAAPLSAASPISTARLPFFEKMRGRLPGLGSPAEPESTPTTAKPIVDTYAAQRAKSRSTSRARGADRPPASPIESESEYGGLAYADSTDYEDNDDRDNDDDFNSRRPPPSASTAAAANTIALLQRGSGTAPVQFGSVSVRSRSRSRSRSHDRGDIRAGGRTSGSTLSREHSVASAYSDDEEGGAARTRAASNASSTSAAVARALGLSQTPPSAYAKLGGPGIPSRKPSTGSNGRTGVGLPANPVKPSASISSKSSVVSFSSEGRRRAVGGGSIDSGRGMGVNALRSRLGVDVAAANESKDKDAAADDEGDSVFGSVGGSRAQRSNTVQGLQSPDAAKKPIKLPTRSLTSPKVEGYKALAGEGGRSAGGAVKKARKPKTCLRCSKVIEDGRWVSVDNGGVLCERCWKNMYLPKCRRCNLPIERQAVSSSDGQLKGKYHKECFNCAICQQPFPDKTFYVYDGKPLCAYHYHEANDSLCAAARCGQPIEGPCAVSHSGDRYHPEHMTCEYPGYPECREQLSEYWEVDGRMLCERHAHTAARAESDEEDERWVQSSKALKRVTRFIDLAGLGALGAGAGGSDLR